MRRRHQKNPLLVRIIGISILVHIIALPILAHFGAFKKIQQQFAGPPVVFIAPPPPPPEREKHEAKKEVKHEPKRTQQVAKRTGTPHQSQAAHQTHLNTPHVIASSSTGGDGGGSVEQGSGKAGVVPTEKNTEPVKPVEPVKPEPVKPEPVKPEPVKPAPTEPVKPVEPVKPEPVKPVVPVVPKQPVFTEAEPMGGQQPQPTIPDDLRSEALDKTCVVEFMVGQDGTPTSVRISQSTNVQELDRLALEAAKRWRFRPATRDGQPVESRIRLHIEFQVS